MRLQVYGAAATRRLRAMGIRDKPIAPGSPWQNGFAERLIGSIRRECVDHIVVLGKTHLRRVLKSYAGYYNETRTHRSYLGSVTLVVALGKDAPLRRAAAARNSNIPILEHRQPHDALRRVRKIQDRHINLLAVKRLDHVLA
jgi:transposase InsO family protein